MSTDQGGVAVVNIRCFLLEPTDKVRHGLRRFCWSFPSGSCQGGFGYHNAKVDLCILTPQNEGDKTSGDYWPHGDPAWPTTCAACGYVFQDNDPWQRTSWPLYTRPHDGQLFTLHDAPLGAMWWADWMAGHDSAQHRARGGGPHLMVKTPGGDWDIDGPSTNGDGWLRQGTPPLVTVTPSIVMPKPDGSEKYHGFLTDGELIPC